MPAPRTVELLRFPGQSPRTTQMYDALIASASAAGVQVMVTDHYLGACDLLMLWGPGHPARFEPMRAQVARGRHVWAFDLAYWSREIKLRVSIDAAHPQAWVMRWSWPADRWRADPAPVADAWDPDGPILVAGIGAKARVQYGAEAIDAWEAEMIRDCRARWGECPIWYRSKRGASPIPSGAIPAPDGPIDRVLAGCRVLVTNHSNVSVDAIRMGIPVVCRDGAAAAVCAPKVWDVHRPLVPQLRDAFLANLAYFQYGSSPVEASECWRFLSQVLA